MLLRAKVLEYLEQNHLDFFALKKNFDVRLDNLASELNYLLEAGYVTKTNDLFILTDRGREYLKVERAKNLKELIEV